MLYLPQGNKSCNDLAAHFKNFMKELLTLLRKYQAKDYWNPLPGNPCIAVITNPEVLYLGVCPLLVKSHMERHTLNQISKSQKNPQFLF